MTDDHDPPDAPHADDHSDEHGEDEHSEGEPHGEGEHGEGEHDDHTLESVKHGTEAGLELAKGIGEIAHGDGAGGASSLLKGAGGALETAGHLVEDEEAKEALEVAGTVAELAGEAVEIGHELFGGGHGGGHSAGGHGAPGGHGAAGGHGAQGAAGHAQSALGDSEEAGHAGTIIGHGEQALRSAQEHGGGGREDVHYHLEVADDDTHWDISSVHLHEEIGALGGCSINATCSGESHPVESEFLSKDAVLAIERGEETRHFRGIVRHARVGAGHGGETTSVVFDLVPALWLAEETQDSRIYQNKKVPELVEELVRELLGDRARKVNKDDLTETYEEHEYLVQHRESHYQFAKRILEEEGIYFYFDHDLDDEEHEVLVLADSNDNRPLAREDHDGVIEYAGEHAAHSVGREVATSIDRQERIGATDATVSGYDWTNPDMQVRTERTDRGEWTGPRLEHYDHHHAVRHHGYDSGGQSYQSHTADRHSRLHTERLDLRRFEYTISTTVVSASPGHIFELRGSEHDGRYLIVSTSAGGSAGGHRGEGGAGSSDGGAYHNSLKVIPATQPYRPERPERTPMPGPETATVVGPSGEEIHTDEHGRVKVQFHWDRQGQNDEHSSAWIRVTQNNWAGSGWGFLFIPRIGMEVMVSFLGGDPDRPVVTGAIYNGRNRTAYTLPDEKTKSYIKTNSTPGGGGYNELRFEDKAGEEEVWIHAQKDFNEVVEHCHSTHVKVDQSNTVDNDQTETIGNDQTMHVKNNRTKTVDVDEKNTIKGNRVTEVGPDGGDDTLWVMKNRVEQIDNNDTLSVTNGYKSTTVVHNKWDIKTKGRLQIIQNENTHFELKDVAYLKTPGKIDLQAGDGAVHYLAKADGNLKIESRQEMQLTSHAQIVAHAQTNFKIQADQKIILEAPTEIMINCGPSSIKLNSSGIEIIGPTIKINATGGATEINASSQVKIKC